MAEMVTIRNAEGVEREWPAAAVQLIEGWTVVSDPPYDPTEHRVDAVIEHLRGLDDEDEITRIVDVEAASSRASVQVAAWATERAVTRSAIDA